MSHSRGRVTLSYSRTPSRANVPSSATMRRRYATDMRKGARLGQHFLIHSWAASALALAAPLQRGETILEIGAGKGILTRELLKQGPVVAIEKDAALVRTLRETFGAEIAAGELRLVEADIRDIVVEPPPRGTPPPAGGTE